MDDGGHQATGGDQAGGQAAVGRRGTGARRTGVRQAEIKLAAFREKIGYPDKWRDYSKLEVKRDDLVGNIHRADAFENARDLHKIGKPVDEKEWDMTPATVNAYYDPSNNDINFPAGIL